MKIETNKTSVILEAENKYDIFQLGQICGNMRKQGVNLKVSLPTDEISLATLTIKKEEFIFYMIKNLK